MIAAITVDIYYYMFWETTDRRRNSDYDPRKRLGLNTLHQRNDNY